MSLLPKTSLLSLALAALLLAPAASGNAADPPPSDEAVSQAIENGIAYLQRELVDEPYGLAFAYFVHRRFGLDEFAYAPARYQELLKAAPADEEKPPPGRRKKRGYRKGELRLFERLLTPNGQFTREDLQVARADFDQMTARALYCDRHPLPPDYAATMDEMAAKGRYRLTHVGLALMWLADNGCEWPVDQKRVDAWADAWAQQVRAQPRDDLSYEAAGILAYLGYADRLPPDYVATIVGAQEADGGWRRDLGRENSHWHPTVLAVWFLLETQQPTKHDTFVPQGTPEDHARAQRERRIQNESMWKSMVASEERLLALTPDLTRLARAIRNLQLPSARVRNLFAETVDVRDIGAAGSASPWPGSPGATRLEFATGSDRTTDRAALDLWRPLLESVESFDRVDLKMVRGAHDPDGDEYEATVALDATARLPSAQRAWIRGKLTVRWRPTSDAESAPWRITGWRTDALELVEAPAPLFKEILAEALRDDGQIEAARRSGHDDLVRRWLANPSQKPHPHFFAPAMDRHPGVAIVDLDADGFDDIYVLPHWGKNLFYRNRGDGTFEEIGAELGLDVDGDASSAVFADFDNDGDPDVFIGRTLVPSLYLENRDGKFVDAEDRIDGSLPRLVSSVSAVDIDQDGLLDVYASTYAVRMLTREGRAPGPRLKGFIPEEDGLELAERLRTKLEVYDLFGPPNVLLRNAGDGKFAVDRSSDLRVFTNTYQSTWADYDRDGDPDVYLANDFGPNHLLRNDGGGDFTDVTEETGTADVGFGMGATWGDYDGDGFEDLYVSNMYSKAGRRITERLGALDPRFPKMARGNTLFRREDNGFTDVTAGHADRGAKAGWSWGGQFADVDNDGHLDLHVLSGYYTAPPEHALPVDT